MRFIQLNVEQPELESLQKQHQEKELKIQELRRQAEAVKLRLQEKRKEDSAVARDNKKRDLGSLEEKYDKLRKEYNALSAHKLGEAPK